MIKLLFPCPTDYDGANYLTANINSVCVCVFLQVTTKTVAQCVEFYYTYKKHVKIGRNGTLIYGEAEPLESKTAEEEMDHKVSERRSTDLRFYC